MDACDHAAGQMAAALERESPEVQQAYRLPVRPRGPRRGALGDGLWHVVETPEERDVFDALGLSYVAPEVRW